MYFKDSEFQCKCGCGMSVADFLKERMEQVRHIVEEPLIITSGARCPSHNEKVGGVPDSAHSKGLAVDISCTNSRLRLKLIDALRSVGFNRIGIASDFIHVDIDPDKDQFVMWHYKR